ncbi:hypothetical protein A7U43_21555 [Mycobacterium adipatum]|uniref:AbiEi antitoxin C-terminal domain-containing protein n=1 Tax=Mycobacterium adipatum TaxID=1682113 RepID=A0A172URV2_9MYCO|nr:hypothetical protein [Mycobacterium adipatum]ANE81534.1 hypothetical protein A7U43_21555 [Mycobacterium adipatum]MBI5735434.1 hypothetical protein [Mycolicibacterium neoaurum]
MIAFVGSEAIAYRAVSRGVLRSRYTAILPNIYVPNGTPLDLEVRAQAAWLWCGRSGVIAGRAAAGLYLTPGAVTAEPIEVIALKSKHPPGVIVRNERIAVEEITIRQNLPVTSPARTALDLARRLDRADAVELIDQLIAATQVCEDDIRRLAGRYPRARGIAAARATIMDIDGGALNAEETRVRLILTDGGMRPTHTQIRVTDGFRETVVAMGWPAHKVGVNCHDPGAQRFPYQAVAAADLLRDLGWLVIDVLPEHGRGRIIDRTRTAVWSRTRKRPAGPR